MFKSQDGGHGCKQEPTTMNNSDHKSESSKCESEANPSSSVEMRSDQGLCHVLSDGDSTIRSEQYLGLEEEEQNLMSMVEEVVDGSSQSQEDWGNLETGDLFNQSSESYQWWDFWS